MMVRQKRTAFYLSDRTAITAETLGHSLLTQFDGITWDMVNIPFIDNVAKAQAVLKQINQASEQDGHRALVFSTLLKPEVLALIKQANCQVFDYFETFIPAIEDELRQPFARKAGRSHGVQHHLSYFKRINAVNFVLAQDDGVNPKHLDAADIILVGVSRSGKTPTCLYLGLQYGIAAANYPLTPDDMSTLQVPATLIPVQDKLFGLTLTPEQLHLIRQERHPNSQYASRAQCENEIQWQEALFHRFNIPFLDTTGISIEEISTIILDRCALQRKLYGL